MQSPSDLERVAESLADSAALDWAALERAHPELGDTLTRLRALERLAAAHREALLVAGGEPAPEPTHAAATSATFTWGPLEVRERLGEGTFGEVYRAHDPSLRRDVALKLRRIEAAGPARAWLDEARRLARVSHPNVLAVLGVAEHDGRAGLWTELVHGETLEARLAREGPLPAREVALVGVELCRALAAVHAERLVHGDVKPANVMCERGAGARRPGRIVLMDFGAGQDGPPASPSMWTPLVSAPEVLRGGEASPSSDQYALGVLLYRLLTARYPFEAESLAGLIERTAKAAPPPLRELRPDVPSELHDAVLRSLAHEPAARHANLSAFERSLAASVGLVAGSSRWPLVAAGAVVLLGTVALLWPARLSPPTVSVPTSAARPAAGLEAARPLEVDATLVRRTASGSEPLLDGGIVRAGDRLSLELRTTEPVWVYVLNEDATGSAYALFPREGLELDNPLAASVEHRLPGKLRGREFAWQVGEGGDRETFLVVAARGERPDIDALVRELQVTPGARSIPAGAPAGGPPLRGVDGLAEEPPARDTNGPVARLARELERARDPDVWMRRVRAVHDPPRDMP